MKIGTGTRGEFQIETRYTDDLLPADLLPPLRFLSAACRATGLRITIDGQTTTTRFPDSGASGADNPFISGGFVLTNSETGCGACALTPRMVAQVCRNGMTITRDARRMIHLGERQQAGLRRRAASWRTGRCHASR